MTGDVWSVGIITICLLSGQVRFWLILPPTASSKSTCSSCCACIPSYRCNLMRTNHIASLHTRPRDIIVHHMNTQPTRPHTDVASRRVVYRLRLTQCMHPCLDAAQVPFSCESTSEYMRGITEIQESGGDCLFENSCWGMYAVCRLSVRMCLCAAKVCMMMMLG